MLGLFDTDVRYLVPIYQRNYKWDEKSHWAPLWTDVCNVAEDVLEMGETGEVMDHFLGAIVCDPMPAYGLDAKAVSVIDGQQRLTTLALLVAAMHGAALDRELASSAYLDPSVRNKPAVVQDRPKHLSRSGRTRRIELVSPPPWRAPPARHDPSEHCASSRPRSPAGLR